MADIPQGVRLGEILSHKAPDSMQAVVATSAEGWGPQPYYDSTIDNTKTELKSSHGNLHLLIIEEKSGATAYLQLFDKASADVTVGTTVPDFVIAVAANEFLRHPFPNGFRFMKALTYAFTTTSGGAASPGTAGELSALYA